MSLFTSLSACYNLSWILDIVPSTYLERFSQKEICRKALKKQIWTKVLLAELQTVLLALRVTVGLVKLILTHSGKESLKVDSSRRGEYFQITGFQGQFR